jgi:AcrR family transcriptional regulator
MRRRISRVPSDERRAQILRAATELFARQGFNGTTTREIADRVRVKETILFRLFPSKRDLYWAVIDEKCRERQSGKMLEDLLVSEPDERKMFTALATGILERNTRDTTLTRLLLFSGLEEHELSERFFQTYITAYFETLANYIRRRIRDGVFRNVNPLLAARGFLGMIFNYVLTQELFGARRFQKFDIAEVGETLTDIWLKGMRTK